MSIKGDPQIITVGVIGTVLDHNPLLHHGVQSELWTIWFWILVCRQERVADGIHG